MQLIERYCGELLVGESIQLGGNRRFIAGALIKTALRAVIDHPPDDVVALMPPMGKRPKEIAPPPNRAVLMRVGKTLQLGDWLITLDELLYPDRIRVRVVGPEKPGVSIIGTDGQKRRVYKELGENETAGVTLVWDAEVLSEGEYAELVGAIGDLVRAEGGLGVQRIRSDGCGIEVGEGVTA